MHDDDFLNLAEAADIGRVTPQAVRLWIYNGRCPGYRRAGRLYVKRAELLEWLAPTRVAPRNSK